MCSLPWLSISPTATPMLDCALPSPLNATPRSIADSLNVPSPWFRNRKFGIRVVGHEQVDLAVLVEIVKHGGKRVRRLQFAKPGLFS